MSTSNDIPVKDVLRLFDLGIDTNVIGAVLQVPESSVYNVLAFAKSVEKNFGSDAQVVRSTPKHEQLVADWGRQNVSQPEVLELESGHLMGNRQPDEGAGPG
jgi:hypothetical protein